MNLKNKKLFYQVLKKMIGLIVLIEYHQKLKKYKPQSLKQISKLTL